MPKSKNKKSTSPAFLLKTLLFFEKFIWIFGIFLMGVVLLVGYRFVLLPQYQQLIKRQQEMEAKGLEEKKLELMHYLADLKFFITLSDSITKEEKNQLYALLAPRPDPLELSLQFEKLFNEHNLEFPGISISESEPKPQVDGTSSDEEGRSVVDLSRLLGRGDEEEIDPALMEHQTMDQPEIEIGYLKLNFSLRTENYFAIKDFLRDIEHRLPVMDVESINISVGSEGGASASFSVRLYYLEEG